MPAKKRTAILANIICKLCRQAGKGKKAHIIPEAFFRALSGYDEKLRLITNQTGQNRPRRSPIGIYDPELVCEQCEDRFLPCDTYAAEVLLNRMAHLETGQQRSELFVAVDYHKLKMFFISVLWRASATSHQFFALSKVGPYEETARQSILANNSGSEDNFACHITRWVSVTGKNTGIDFWAHRLPSGPMA